MKNSTVLDCRTIILPKSKSRTGNLTAIDNSGDVLFPVKRVYYLYDVPGGEVRGGHAHKELKQLIIAASGAFDVVIEDGKDKKTVSLNRPDQGLYIVPGIWRELVNFSSGAICLVLASEIYSADDYIRDYERFNQIKRTAAE